MYDWITGRNDSSGAVKLIFIGQGNEGETGLGHTDELEWPYNVDIVRAVGCDVCGGVFVCLCVYEHV